MRAREAFRTVPIVVGLLGSPQGNAAPVAARPLPVIDMHLHASRLNVSTPVPVCPGNRPIEYPAIDPGRPSSRVISPDCEKPILSPLTGVELKARTITELRRYNVRRAVLAGTPELVADWSKAAPGQFIPAATPRDRSADALADLRRMHDEGRAAIFAEVGAQYSGLRADDPSLVPFWTLAEQLDVPVGIHLGEGQPGQGDERVPLYRAKLTSPFQLEEVLIRHPRLRLYVMHAASPLTDEMIAMLFEYPQLYVDVGANVWNMPRAQFYGQLKRLTDAGFSRRVLFGSDQTIWPEGIGLGIETINEAPFLSARQKRDILYNNAARFLRLSAEQIARDHAK